MNSADAIEATADAISSLLQAAPHQKLHVEQIESRLSPAARTHMRDALTLLGKEGTVASLNNIYYALLPE